MTGVVGLFYNRSCLFPSLILRDRNGYLEVDSVEDEITVFIFPYAGLANSDHGTTWAELVDDVVFDNCDDVFCGYGNL